MKYKAIIPFIDDMGTVPTFIVSNKISETKGQEALWHLNSMREHDGLKPMKKLPYGTKFEPIEYD